MLDILDIDCADRAYTPKNVEDRTVERVGYVHLVVEFVTRTVPLEVDQRSFYFKKSGIDAYWSLIPLNELEPLKELKFDQSVPLCDDDKTQVEHHNIMGLTIADDITQADF